MYVISRFWANTHACYAYDTVETGVACVTSCAPGGMFVAKILLYSGGSGNLSIFTIKLVYFIFDLP
jgi:hypothetical protein